MTPLLLACAWLGAWHKAGAAWSLWPDLDRGR